MPLHLRRVTVWRKGADGKRVLDHDLEVVAYDGGHAVRVIAREHLKLEDYQWKSHDPLFVLRDEGPVDG